MIALAVAIAAALLALLWSYALPESPALHYGWVSAALIALTAWGWYRSKPRSAAMFALNGGAAMLTFAFAANGLLAPDAQQIVGAPGQDARVSGESFLIRFPGVDAAGTRSQPVQLVRGSRVDAIEPVRITFDRRFRLAERDCVYVQAFDARGGSLTITQPTGAVFLSPVLLMQQRQAIANLTVPFDSFAVPAVHRIVKAVLFTAAQSAALHAQSSGLSILFAVDDQNDVPLPHAISMTGNGQRVSVGGVQLRGVAFSYPAVVCSSIPNVLAVCAGLLVLFAGAFLRLRTPSRS